MRNVMIVKRVISICVLTVWVLTQTTMLFAHAAIGKHGGMVPSAAPVHSHVDAHAGHGNQTADETHHDHGVPHPDMSEVDCCSNICTADAQLLACSFGSQVSMPFFNGAKVKALTAAELGSQTPPPNTTI